jgi:hypothetical protein
MEQDNSLDNDLQRIIKLIKGEQELALQLLSPPKSNNQNKESMLNAILNLSDWQTHDSDAKRVLCRSNGIFVWKSDPESMVADLPELAARLFLVTHPKDSRVPTDTKLQNVAVGWCTQKSGLKKAWRTMPFDEVVDAIKHLKDKCEDFQTAVNFLKSSHGIPPWKSNRDAATKNNNNNNG